VDDLLSGYRKAAGRLPERHQVWRLPGPGLSELEPPVEEVLPKPGPDELLVRHDAVGICYSDVKVAKLGLDHPRVRRFPVVPGHEVALTVVAVGPAQQDAYAPGDRFIVQANMTIDGVERAYGYDVPGGLAQYAVLTPQMLPYLVPVRSGTGYAEAALAEPWACVEAAYAASYRSGWREGGTVWLTGDGAGVDLGDAVNWRPARVYLDVRDEGFAGRVRDWAKAQGIEVAEGEPENPDDVVVLGPEPDLVERAIAVLNRGGTCAVVTAEPMPRRVRVDVGRLHYDGIALLGTTDSVAATAYQMIRTELKPGGRLWVLGASGPMGRMHVQRAQERTDGPAEIVATDRSGRAAKAFGESKAEGEFDDIAVMAPDAQAVEDAFTHLADGGVINLFAGVPRGTLCEWDLTAVTQRGVRVVGTSGSSVADLRRVRDRIESGALQPNRSVVAVAGLAAMPEVLRAVADGRFDGKVVIFPNLTQPLPLTPVTAWSVAAEAELLGQA